MFRYLGWCSRDAFYTDVNEEGIRNKSRELTEKNIPVRWMIVDDGWFRAKDRCLYDFAPDSTKFPQGLGSMTAVFDMNGKDKDCSFTPSEVSGITGSERYWVYNWFTKAVSEVGKNEAYTCAVRSDGCGWYVILPKACKAVCLGLTDKYVGFSAVESISETDSTQTVILREKGTISWVCETAPRRITANGKDVTNMAQFSGEILNLPMEEAAEKTAITVEW